jgi:hypothetical protein
MKAKFINEKFKKKSKSVARKELLFPEIQDLKTWVDVAWDNITLEQKLYALSDYLGVMGGQEALNRFYELELNEGFDQNRSKEDKRRILLGINDHIMVVSDDEGAQFRVFTNKDEALEKYEEYKKDGMERYSDNWGALFEIIEKDYSISTGPDINGLRGVKLIDDWERMG